MDYNILLIIFYFFVLQIKFQHILREAVGEVLLGRQAAGGGAEAGLLAQDQPRHLRVTSPSQS